MSVIDMSKSREMAVGVIAVNESAFINIFKNFLLAFFLDRNHKKRLFLLLFIFKWVYLSAVCRNRN